MENTLKKPMTGIIPPLVTPLLDNDKLDIDGLERLIVRYFFILLTGRSNIQR